MMFDLCVAINYKIRLLKVQVLKSYKTLVIQKSYGGSKNRVKSSQLFSMFAINNLLVISKTFYVSDKSFSLTHLFPMYLFSTP